MAKLECTVCGFIYDEEKKEKKWKELPNDWRCPVCSSSKTNFKQIDKDIESHPSPPAPQTIIVDKTRKKQVCRLCGYIVGPEFSGDQCPACGAPKTAFQPYKDPLSPKRRKILDLHLHPISIHFSQAFSLFMLFLIVMGFILTDTLKADVFTAAKVMAIFLPLSTIISILSGLLDGKNRFNRITTPILKKKILIGSLFFIFSIGVLLIMVFTNLQPGWHVLSAVLTTLCVLCSLFLGYHGARLSGTATPG